MGRQVHNLQILHGRRTSLSPPDQLVTADSASPLTECHRWLSVTASIYCGLIGAQAPGRVQQLAGVAMLNHNHNQDQRAIKQPGSRPPQPDDPRSFVERHALANRHGVILRSEVEDAGLNQAQIDRRVRRGHWVPAPVRGAWILASHVDDPLAKLTAATAGLSAVAWGRSVLGLWGLVEHPARPEIASRKQLRCSDVASTRVRDLAAFRTIRHRQITTVSLELGLASVAPYCTLRELNEFVDETLRRRLSAWPRIELAWQQVVGQGRPGSALVMRVIKDRSADLAVPLSQWSRDFAAKLVTSGLPRPQMEYRVLDESGRLIAQVDLAYPEYRYAIEIDSVAFHLNSEAFEVDRRRDADLARQGWSVARFTWNQYTNSWDQVIATIASQIGIGLG